MARRVVMICYDVADPKRLREVFKTCKQYAEHVQFSVFVGRLSASRRTALCAELEAIIHHREDRILLIDIGPDNDRVFGDFESLGQPWRLAPRGPLII